MYFSQRVQDASTPSGDVGEPKFNLNGTAYTGPWGRPQNDGPALRAMTFIRYANTLLGQGRDISHLYHADLPPTTPIKRDLEFVAHHWGDTCFDIWEEVRGTHVYTRLVQRRALIRGADLATRCNDSGAASYYLSQASAIADSLSSFWDPSRNYLQTTLNRDGGLDYKTSGLDVQIILGALHAFDPTLDKDDAVFTPDSDQILATANVLTERFATEYGVNQKYPNLAVAIGRYPEDRYDGTGMSLGNPWVLATLGLGELAYRTAASLRQRKQLQVTPTSYPYYRKALNASVTLQSSELVDQPNKLNTVIEGLITQGDAFMNRVRFHTGSDLDLHEQFNRDTGFMQGATELTWSHAAFETALSARRRAMAGAKRILVRPPKSVPVAA